MKKRFLIFPVLTLLVCGCSNNNSVSNSVNNSSTSSNTNNNNNTNSAINQPTNNNANSAINQPTNNNANNGVATVQMNLSNFERYISCTRYEGFTGAAGYSPYEAWLEFKGLLSIGVYDVTVTYVVGSTSYNYYLDVSGGGKTNSFDRSLTCSITNVSGTVSYRL